MLCLPKLAFSRARPPFPGRHVVSGCVASLERTHSGCCSPHRPPAGQEQTTTLPGRRTLLRCTEPFTVGALGLEQEEPSRLLPFQGQSRAQHEPCYLPAGQSQCPSG